MKHLAIFLFSIITVPIYAQTTDIIISGKVTDVWETPIPDANILIKNTELGTNSDTQGQFVIQATIGEVLVISSVGFGTIELVVDEQMEDLKVVLSPQTTKLREVVVQKKKRKRQKELLADYQENTNLIKTSFGILDKDRSSTAMRFVEGKDLINVGTDFLASLKNHVPSMRVVRPPHVPDVEVYLRRVSVSIVDTSGTMGAQPKAIFDVDGMIFESTPTYLSASDIDRLVVLERNAAMSRYGPRGVGGVIIVNTKGKNRMDEMGIVRRYDNSEMRDSLYTLFDSKNSYVPENPEYLDVFGRATSHQEAKALLKTHAEAYATQPYFFLDMAQYFRGRWDDQKTANQLLKDVRQNFGQNIPALRSLAYTHETQGQNDLASETYLQILQQDATAPQSYIDLANAYVALGNQDKAAEVYRQFKENVQNGRIPETGEMDSFFNLEPPMISPTRIVMTWSNPEINLGIQIINPESQYKTWDNNENQEGSTTKQFLFEEEPKGEWQINLQLFEGTTTYLRVTSYFDYGLPTQHQKQMLFKLTPNYQGNHLFSVNTQKDSIIE
ncbi:carboxypeptidase-like regulatory domain-containing protein [Flagellimonas flava]|uniref:carboxypeptidase-like regulatory domain-containing protein n=1 Tax=Flagellimonas flava TaxID=570519 RepID=UPI003D6469BB